MNENKQKVKLTEKQLKDISRVIVDFMHYKFEPFDNKYTVMGLIKGSTEKIRKIVEEEYEKEK
jgi:hypothetical protein